MAASKAAKAVAAADTKIKYLLGICVPSWKSNAAKIQIPLYEYDARLHMYFRTTDFVYAHDPNKICKTGDTVLIQNLKEKLTRLITHQVIEVVYPLGDVTDPVTGEKVSTRKYRKEIEEIRELSGKSETGFDYEKAPPRGSQEDKRDFTHKPAYKKYYEDPDNPQPYAY